MTELEHVPTTEELIRMGLARRRIEKRGKQKVQYVWIDPKGHDLMGEIMIRNGRKLRDHSDRS